MARPRTGLPTMYGFGWMGVNSGGAPAADEPEGCGMRDPTSRARRTAATHRVGARRCYYRSHRRHSAALNRRPRARRIRLSASHRSHCRSSRGRQAAMSQGVGRAVRRRACSWVVAVAAVIAAIGVAAAPAAGQIPDKFTNLKVLPKDTPKPKLVETMRGFSNALGV